jgi:hypothetical protein
MEIICLQPNRLLVPVIFSAWQGGLLFPYLGDKSVISSVAPSSLYLDEKYLRVAQQVAAGAYSMRLASSIVGSGAILLVVRGRVR